MNILRLKGTTKTLDVIDQRDGQVAGRTTEHWDDHVDALALMRRVSLHVPDGGIAWPDGRRVVRRDSDLGLEAMKRGAHPVIAGGAWTVSGLYLLNWIDLLDATQLAIDTSLTSHKIAMYNNTETPNFSTEDGYAVTNEVTGTGYTAGGQVIVSPTTTESPAGTLMYDLGDQVWASPTSVTARGAKLYADVLVGNDLIVGINFGSDFTSTAGTFTIQWASTGCFTIDLTP